METRASYTLVGAFVLGLMGVFIGVAIWLAGVELGKTPTRYLIYFEGDVTGLGIGSPVRYRGVPVGSVQDIRIDSKNVERIQVTIEVSQTTPIKTDTVAELSLQGITGVAFIQLTGGTQGAPQLVASSRKQLAVIKSRRSLLQEVVNRLPQLLEKAVNIADRVTLLFDQKNIDAVSVTLQNLRKSSDLLTADNGEFRQLLGESRDTVRVVKDAIGDFRKIAQQLNERIGPLADNTGATIADARLTLAEIRKAAAGVTKITNTVESVLKDSEGPVRDFASSGLYELSMFLSEARVLVDALTRLVNRIERDPAQFFFGDSQRGIEAK